MMEMEQAAFSCRMEEDCRLVEQALRERMSQVERYADLAEAMEYSLMAGGKRIRPILVLESCRMCGGDPAQAMDFACSLEMVHTYSLIHDDLPAMDNDDLRRGRPTNHKVYGEATAILAGDALLTHAFSVLTRAPLPPERVAAAVAVLAGAAGPNGMAGGQALDMAGEGRGLTRSELEQLQRLKTGALIQAAVELGCIAAGGTPQQREALCIYAQAVGLAFQIQDDILDVTSSDEELGKPVGSDRANEKSTFVSVLGLEDSRRMVEELTCRAGQALDGFTGPEFLLTLAGALSQRKK